MASEGWERIRPRLTATVELQKQREPSVESTHMLVPYAPDRTGAYADVRGERFLLMSGYSYLGLGGDERVVAAAKAAVDAYGTGTHGVRMLAGTLPLHQEVEQAVARIADRPAAMVFSSGYAANLGAIETLCGRGDEIFIDKLAHASIVDGCTLSGASVTRFRHNDAADLARRLQRAEGDGVRLVIVDSVYSMDGDIAPLPALREVCDAHGALLMVDEAHALGVIGETGRGVEEHFGGEIRADIKAGTLSKAIPSAGGYVAGPADLMMHLRYNTRPFMFSAALPAAQLGAALEALRILQAEPERVAHVQTQSERLRRLLQEGGLSTHRSETAVIPLIAGSAERAWAFATACRREGVVALPVVTPAVPNGFSRLRIAVTAAHTEADLDIAAKSFITAARECGVLTDQSS